jgi:hypothetical protein
MSYMGGTLEGTTPLISDRYILTFIAGEAISVGDILELTADLTVKKPTTNKSTKIVGIALTAAANGAKVSVICRGLIRTKAYGTITAGDGVSVYAGGLSVQTDASFTQSIIGIAVQGASSGGTALIEMW